jgi:hypothetical protein
LEDVFAREEVEANLGDADDAGYFGHVRDGHGDVRHSGQDGAAVYLSQPTSLGHDPPTRRPTTMDKFFANLTGKEKESAANKWQGGQSDMRSIRPSPKKNVFANMALPKQRQRTAKPPPGGQSLGGSQPGTLQPMTLECKEKGGLKRSGGIGDVLAGVISAFIAWNTVLRNDFNENKYATPHQDRLLATWTACCAVKKATCRAFERKARTMSAQHVLEDIGDVIKEMEEDLECEKQ